MITINFYPESDKKNYIQAAAEYAKIWKNDGEKIFNEIEKLSGLRFTTKIINAVTFEGISYSTPLRLRSSYPENHKKATLIHELCHRLMIDNHFYVYDAKNISEDVHKIIDLILFDLWINLIGETEANKSKETEIGYGDPAYRNAWEWALSFDYKQRQLKFKEVVKKYANYKGPLKPPVKTR